MPKKSRFEASGQQFQRRLVDYFVVYTCKPRRRIVLEEDHPSKERVDSKRDDHLEGEFNEVQHPLHSSVRKVGNRQNSKRVMERTASRSVHLRVAPDGGLPAINSNDATVLSLSDNIAQSNIEHHKSTHFFRGLRIPVIDDQDVNKSYDGTDDNDSVRSQQKQGENNDVNSNCNDSVCSLQKQEENDDGDGSTRNRIGEHEMSPTRIRPKYSDNEDETDIEEDNLRNHMSASSLTDNIIPPASASNEDDGAEIEGLLLNNEFTLVPVQTARYPKEDHPDCPMNPMVPHFCFPLSMHISKEYKIPQVHYFVLTNDKGKKMYGVCLTVWEEYIASDNGNRDEIEFSDFISKKGVIHIEGMNETDIEVSLTSKSVSVYVPKVLCILSSHAYLQSFREYLAQLYRLATMTNMMEVPIERYIVNICDETPAPPPGSFEIRLKILNSELAFWAPPANQPVAYVALPFNVLFECLDLSNIIFVWYALTLERKILLLSSHCSLLTICAEILCSLLFPMEWNHLYIPILPRFLSPMLDAPIPYLCGIARQHLEHAIQSISDETIVVDLDQNLITLGVLTPPFPPIPKKRRLKLEQSLELNAGDVFWAARGLTTSDVSFDENKTVKDGGIMKKADLVWKEKLQGVDHAFNLGFRPDSETLLNGEIRNEALDETFSIKYKQTRWDNVQESFLRFYVSMLRDYKKFVATDHGFNTKDFIRSQRSDYKLFLKEFCHTQQFDCFVTKKIFHSQDPAILFFDQSINAKRNRSKMSLKKKETSFLTEAQAHIKLRTIYALHPAGKEIDGNNLIDMIYRLENRNSTSFQYHSWPENFNECLLGSARPIPVAIAAEFERLDTATSKSLFKKHTSVDERNFQPTNFFPNIQTATFTLFLVLFCKGVVGKEFESMHTALLEGGTHLNVKDRLKFMAGELNQVIVEEIDDSLSSQRLFPDCVQICSSCVDQLKNVTGKTDILVTMKPMDDGKVIGKDRVSEADVETAQLLAVGQLDLAFSVFEIMLEYLPVDQESCRVLMEACGRCGDTVRATQLMSVMKQKRVVVDSEMYANYIAAFTISNRVKPDTLIPIPLTSIRLSSSRNRSHQSSFMDLSISERNESNDLSVNQSTEQSQSDVRNGADTSGNDSSSVVSTEFKSESSCSRPQWLHSSGVKTRRDKMPIPSKSVVVSELVERHISIGDTLLDYLYDGVKIECKGDTCPNCSVFIDTDTIMMGWTLCSFVEYATVCIYCKHRFIPRFVVDTNSTSFIGSQGPGTPLYCDFLSPWVVQREMYLATDGFENFDSVLKPEWRSENDFRAKLWWNIIVLFKEHKLPFSFLLQGSFQNHLILPMEI